MSALCFCIFQAILPSLFWIQDLQASGTCDPTEKQNNTAEPTISDHPSLAMHKDNNKLQGHYQTGCLINGETLKQGEKVADYIMNFE